jgi:hypothetical protein
MNTFYEHHQDSIRFACRCFDRILLNGLIKPFQQPKRVVGFFGTHRNQYPVSRDLLRDIAEQYHHWVKNRSMTWDVPILDAPPDARDRFVEPYFRRAKPNQVVAILKAREPARMLIAIGRRACVRASRACIWIAVGTICRARQRSARRTIARSS